ncbi:MAG: 3-phosphoshikimate 1-carboxyvinyltransferase [Streptococcaceae bacterium]|jgi:3-phosphoshikimate 1-carboxyvinyltransferase|nr:3-phosphoshikimate 1-carboxyvinyltransferase [Streptococcaceae bacterium]
MGLRGNLKVPADKSMSHRAVMFGALAKGQTKVHNILLSEDVKTTIQAFQQLGLTIQLKGSDMVIEGRDFTLTQPSEALDMGNSGTTTRLIMGILAAQNFDSELKGDPSLSKRPMNRVAIPLTVMGADIRAQGVKGTLPIHITGKKLHPLDFEMPVASAQVKSALIFAALQTAGKSKITEEVPSRNHTEQMLKAFGGTISIEGKKIIIEGPQHLRGTEMTIPGDISSAAFWIAAALITPDSDILLENVGVNPTRTGILDVVKAMGGKLELLNVDDLAQTADIHVQYTETLKSVTISGDLIPRLIDEIPVIALLATQAEGETLVKDAAELKVKESDRIIALVEMLRALGADAVPTEDGLIVQGQSKLQGALVDSYGDHRLAMTAAIAGLIADGEVQFAGGEMIATSYPNFYQDMDKLCQ